MTILDSPPAPGPVPTRTRRRLTILVSVIVVLAVVAAVALVRLWPQPVDVTVSGITDGELAGPARLQDMALQAVPSEGTGADDVALLVDGAPAAWTAEGPALVWRPAGSGLADGPHQVRVEVAGRGPFGRDRATTLSFTVDATPPVIALPTDLRADSPDQPLTMSGTVQGADSVTVDGAQVAMGPDGTFTATFTAPPAQVVATAADAAGNTASAQVPVVVPHPGMRAVHMTALAWSADSLREPILDLLRSKKIDTIELDVKDEDGIVGYDTQVPLARQVGANAGHYDAAAAIQTIHDLGGRVVGRIVAFRDPKLGEWSWNNGARQRVVQTPSGEPYGKDTYGPYSFTNPADAEVRQYNIDLAVEAAHLGFDDVLYDYIRRPDGKLDKLVFPGWEGDPSPIIVEFLKGAHDQVRPAGAFVGASVYGISATRGDQIAQNIPEMASTPTTCRRWCTRRTGARASTTCPIPTPPPTRSCSARWSTSRAS